MTLVIIIGIFALIIGAVIGWKARGWKDSFDADIDRVFYEAWKNNT